MDTQNIPQNGRARDAMVSQRQICSKRRGQEVVDVSVIMPVYNVECFIRSSLDSVLAQTFQNIEIILVDDGSTDGSGEICDEYEKKDSRVLTIHKANGGAGEARNIGLERARGKYVLFCDADDSIDCSLIEDNYWLAEKYRADIVTFGMQKVIMGTHGEIVNAKIESRPGEFAVYSYKEFWDHFQEYVYLINSACTHLFRRDHLNEENIRFVKQRTGEDAIFLYDFYAAPFSCIVFNPSIYYIYRIHSGSTTNARDLDTMEREYLVAERFDVLISEKEEISQRYHAFVAYKYVMVLCVGINSFPYGDTDLLKQKIKITKSFREKSQMRNALKCVKLKMFSVESTKIKVLLLKLNFICILLILDEFRKKEREKGVIPFTKRMRPSG